MPPPTSCASRAGFKAASRCIVSTATLEADAKSILSILSLAASRGTELRVVANGVDEEEALDAVVGLFSRDFDETEREDFDQSRRCRATTALPRARRFCGRRDRAAFCVCRRERAKSIERRSRKRISNANDVVFARP